METTFGIILLAIDRGSPRSSISRKCSTTFLEFRKEVVVRRTTFDLAQAEERAHILEGLSSPWTISTR